MSQKMIFHYPGELYTETNTGEKLRPVKLLNAFRSLNYDVYEITGTYKKRSQLISALKDKICEFDFLYSENSNMPLSLCNQNRIPQLFSADFELFKLCRSNKVISGVFIRDVFWQVKETAHQMSFIKRNIGKCMFSHEVNFYYKNCHTIFLPTQTLKKYLPSTDFNNLISLPPGADLQKTPTKNISKTKRFIYVGSCKPPVYQVIDGFKLILEIPNAHLTIITRPDEHASLKSKLDLTKKNLTITTAFGVELSKLLSQHDIALACVQSNEYWDIAMPIKIFEYLGHGLPIITFNNGETASLIKENDLGWALAPDANFIKKVSEISDNEIDQKSIQANNFAQNNTWSDRAKTIIKHLKKN